MHQQKKTKRLFTYQCILPHRVFLNWQCLYLPKTSQYAGLLKIEYEHEMYYTESKREQRTSEKRDIGKTRRQNSKTSHFPITYKLTVYLSIMVYLSVVVQRVVESPLFPLELPQRELFFLIVKCQMELKSIANIQYFQSIANIYFNHFILEFIKLFVVEDINFKNDHSFCKFRRNGRQFYFRKYY